MQIPRCSPFFISKDGGKQKSMLAGSSGQDHTVLYCVLGGAAAAALILGFADGSDFFVCRFWSTKNYTRPGLYIQKANWKMAQSK